MGPPALAPEDADEEADEDEEVEEVEVDVEVEMDAEPEPEDDPPKEEVLTQLFMLSRRKPLMHSRQTLVKALDLKQLAGRLALMPIPP